jgi:prepilin peptidase CpaA
MTLALWLVLAASAVAAYTDVATRRIPNALAIALCVAGVAVHVTEGFAPVFAALALALAVMIVGTLIFSLGLIGGGDVKLVAAAAAALGSPGDVVALVLYTMLAGGIIALIFSLAQRRIGTTLANVRAISSAVAIGLRPTAPTSSTTMPYALAIFAGAALLASAHTFAPMLRISL